MAFSVAPPHKAISCPSSCLFSPSSCSPGIAALSWSPTAAGGCSLAMLASSTLPHSCAVSNAVICWKRNTSWSMCCIRVFSAFHSCLATRFSSPISDRHIVKVLISVVKRFLATHSNVCTVQSLRGSPKHFAKSPAQHRVYSTLPNATVSTPLLLLSLIHI